MRGNKSPKSSGIKDHPNETYLRTGKCKTIGIFQRIELDKVQILKFSP